MRRLLAVLAMVVALGPAAVLGAQAVDAHRRSVRAPVPLPTSDPLPLGPGPLTPVFSLRRVPTVLLGPARDEALRAAVAPITARLDERSCLVVAADGRPLVAVRPELPLAPASNQKVLTAFAALSVLGPDHRSRTTVVAAGPVRDGVVAGDVWLVGGGDRFLVTAGGRATWSGITEPTSLEVLADAVVAAGVREIRGGVVGDESRYDQLRSVPSWPERYLAARRVVPLSALQVDGAGGFADDPPPAQAAAGALTRVLAERGVTVAGPPSTGRAPADAVVLAAVDGPALTEVVREALTESDNTTAELLLKELGLAAAGEGTTAAGAAAVEAAVAAAGVPMAGVDAVDGSGLDPANRLTCAAQVALLDAAGPSSPLVEGLAVAGRTGTLADRFAGSTAVGRFRGKTGSIREVLTLAGIVEATDGRRFTFALFANGAGAERTEALWRPLLEVLVDPPVGPDPAAVGPLTR